MISSKKDFVPDVPELKKLSGTKIENDSILK